MTETDTIRPMRPAEAWGYAATWGSYMNDGDPGACMYGFDESFTMQNESHRARCLAWVEDCKASVRKDPAAYDDDEMAKLEALEAAMRFAPTDDQVTERLSSLDEFTTAYIAAALWSTHDNHDPETGGDPFDTNYGPGHIHPDTLAEMVKDCRSFMTKHAETLARCGGGLDQAGHDLWLTRCGHGAGFWDRDDDTWDKAAREELTASAHAYGDVDLYVGDDGLIHA